MQYEAQSYQQTALGVAREDSHLLKMESEGFSAPDELPVIRHSSDALYNPHCTS